MRTYVNIMIVFLVSGIWHGANWTFIVWGLIHGALNCLNRIFKETWEKLNIAFRWMVTFTVVDLLWLLFRADSVSQAVYLLKKMMCMDSISVSQELIDSVAMVEISFWEINSFSGIFKYIAVGVQYLYNKIYGFNLWAIIFLAFFIVLNLKNTDQILYKRSLRRSLVIAVMLVWSMVSFTDVATYIYAGF